MIINKILNIRINKLIYDEPQSSGKEINSKSLSYEPKAYD